MSDTQITETFTVTMDQLVELSLRSMRAGCEDALQPMVGPVGAGIVAEVRDQRTRADTRGRLAAEVAIRIFLGVESGIKIGGES